MRRRPEELGRVVATGRRCGDCQGPMLRREMRRGFAWICSNPRCGAMVSADQSRQRDTQPNRRERPRHDPRI